MFGRKGVKRVESIEPEDLVPEVTEGFSLEELGSAYAQAIEQATGVPLELNPKNADVGNTLVDQARDNVSTFEEALLEAPEVTETDGVQVTPEAILEAMLFLGSSNNRPLSIEKLTECFRGVSKAELDQAIDSLNQLYRQHHRAMEIVREPGGYRMQLAPELHLVRDKFYSKAKETQLTQSAIDCLALVAYQPGITREEIEKQWNQPAASMLSNLVRRGLLRIEKPSTAPASHPGNYFTTDRFLDVIGLDSLDDLPLADELN